jgi:ubiquinone/menaquinone biosynthesis C-methylase UbiE
LFSIFALYLYRKFEVMNTTEIAGRYTALANDTCCLSCGGAADKGEAKLNEVCIDLGSGRGTDVLRLAEQVGEGGFVYGIDVTVEMIRKATTTAAKMGVENVKFIQADLEQIPLEDETANLIISNCTLNHVSNKPKVWSEIYRLLKNGGRFVISDIYSSAPVPEEYANDPVAVAECWAGAVTRNEYMKIVKNAGFRYIQVLEESKPYPKGKIQVSSFTITAERDDFSCCD